MKVLKDDSPPGQKVLSLEEFMRTNNIQIYSRNELFVEVDGRSFEVRDTDGGSGGGCLPRDVDSERLVLID